MSWAIASPIAHRRRSYSRVAALKSVRFIPGPPLEKRPMTRSTKLILAGMVILAIYLAFMRPASVPHLSMSEIIELSEH